MQFQIPQFIETEDKIVGPFSLRQFLYVGGAGAVSFLLFFTVQIWLWGLISVFLLGISLALAFIKINGRPLINVILSAISFYWQPQTYLWQPDRPKIKKEESLKSS